MKIIGFFLLLPFLSMVSGCTSEHSTLGDPSPNAYQRVISSKQLRVAYISYPPSFLKDAKTGQYSGIFHEVLFEMAQRMNLEVNYVEETAWGTMIEAVNSGRVDLVCTGLWPNATRGLFVDFTEPVYFSPVRAYVRAEDRRFDGDLARINNPEIRIAAIDGEMTSIIAKADFPNATVRALPQTTDVSQVLLELTTGKADVTFVEPAIASAYLRTNPGLIVPVANVAPVRVFPNVMMMAKGEFQLQSMLNVALAELVNTGFVDQTIDRYETEPGLFLRRALPYRQ